MKVFFVQMTDLEAKRKARKQLLTEFRFTPKTKELMEDKMSMERYNIVIRADGQKVPSTRWSCPVEQLWIWNNGSSLDAKGRPCFATVMKVDGITFYRRALLAETILRVDLQRNIADQLRSMGYDRCWFKPVWRTDRDTAQEYQTFIVHVQVG